MSGGTDYGNPNYWDERYSADEEPYDWYQDYFSLEPFLVPYLVPSQEFEILVVGCGNSNLSSELFDSGFTNITNIDISKVVISQMSDRNTERSEMEFMEMDARRMEYIPDQCFDLVIDKALSDALLCSENNLQDTELLWREVYRVLKTGGIYIIISHAVPEKRLQLIANILPNISIETCKISKPEVKVLNESGDQLFHYMYVCRKIQA